jgi:hypothetical protein
MNSPLAIFVLWHHRYLEGEQFANQIFGEFKRKVSDPLSRGMNIPVFFRSHETVLKEIPYQKYENVIVVALIEARFVNDARYKDYLKEIVNTKAVNIKLIPVAITRLAFNAGIGEYNFVRLYEQTDKYQYLISTLAHEVARILYSLPATRTDKSAPRPLRLFISHAKADGVDIAKRIKLFAQSETALDVFFDANNIAVGHEFSQEIETHISDAVVIAVQTDQYASREWCRREILLAKKYNRPIVILNCLKDGESRSFPYMANVLTVHFLPMDEMVWLRLMASVMKETLRLKYQEKWLTYVLHKKKILHSNDHVSAYPPELITALPLAHVGKKRFIYPDPAIGTEELEILKKLSSEIQYVTPSEL